MTNIATQGLQFREPLIFERSSPGRSAASLPASATELPADARPNIPAALLRTSRPAWPEVSEPEATRHFLRLSQQNYSIDTGFFPLGSCTMKYNPKINEEVARLDGFWGLHPLAPTAWVQGALAVMWQLERYLAEITGFSDVTLQPAAGAQGEWTGMALIRAHLIATEGGPRKKVLVPDTAHGTNPATLAMLGYEVVTLKSSDRGVVLPQDVAAAMGPDVAGIMMTNPNTLGLFEENVKEIADIVHAGGGYVYCDGANMNALLGRARPGDMGVDAMHLNLHKTFSTPHGGGGPGSGPVCVHPTLAPYLPTPRVERHGDRYTITSERPLTIGRVKAFLGNFGMHVRAYTYIRELGREGLLAAGEMAVLNANYLRVRLADTYHVVHDRPCMHEVVLTDRHQKKATDVDTRDSAKGLIDRGFHPPTTFFPICVTNAIMIEPTETESKETLDAFVDAMKDIDREARVAPERVKGAPHLPIVGRIDETRAVRKPILRWRPQPS
ncbi:MAG: aminomethyl-transferring glycine dehydrogenase subunit GcvPB [Deltaproteobacteria bacterium]|nr:aminomethyl-transferring glycine dehydrogenase subunit GcvPB [Deltaproteobacteria bacterium]